MTTSNQLKSIGAQMANVMFNLAQGGNLPADTRDMMREMQQKWDAAIRDTTPPPEEHVVLAPKHTGLRVDYTGLLKNARHGLRREPGTAEMLNQLEEHLSELGRRWYDGDATVVDEFLQLYCIQRVRRDVLVGTSEEQP